MAMVNDSLLSGSVDGVDESLPVLSAGSSLSSAAKEQKFDRSRPSVQRHFSVYEQLCYSQSLVIIYCISGVAP